MVENVAAVVNGISKPANGGSFRLDINALRALAVVAVVGYHFQLPGFVGGFVGVDVFLVITGYLMTGKVLTDLERGRFSLRDFVTLRMRRIYPALAVMTVSAVVAGWFVTLPREYLKHLLQALSALAFVSNFAFNSDNGYFSMAAQTKPLLHTWSLSVEWQFYIWMPLIVWLVWRLASGSSRSAIRTVTILFQVVAAVSLAWCLWNSQSDATGSSFFSLRSRAWEPLAGGLIAAAEIQRRSKSVARLWWLETRLVAVLGWALVAGCIVYPLQESQWPGGFTLLPILGAAMIVGARQGIDRGVLGMSPIQRLGEWSYSIYLWHWPIWVFALSWLSLRGYSVDATQKTIMVLASVAIGAISYRYIEQPARLRRDLWTPSRLMTGSGITFVLLLGFVALAFLDNGFPTRLPEYLRSAELARRTNTPRDECFRNSNSIKTTPGVYCSFGSPEASGTPSAILWGDSFANQYLEPITSTALANGIHGLIATQSGCRAFIDNPSEHSGDQKACREFNRSTLDFVLGHAEPSIVLLGSNWGSGREASALVDRLISTGKTVVLIMPLLNVGFDVPQRWIENQIRAGQAIKEWKVRADPDLTMQKLRDEFVKILQKHRTDPRLIAVDPMSVICEHEYCYLVRNGEANFRDTAHISNVNAIQFRDLFDNAFKSALRARTELGKQTEGTGP